MKRFPAFILTFMYLLALLQPIAPWAGYQLNKSFIAAELCENVSKPILQCDGKCYLRKQISQQEKESSAPQQTISEVEELAVSLMAEAIAIPEFKDGKQYHLPPLLPFISLFPDPVFHPPTS